MAFEKKDVLPDSSDGSISGAHPDPGPFQFFVGTSTSNESNTARLRLIPLACWRVDDVRFAFDTSFVSPDIAQEIKILADLRKQYCQCDGAGSEMKFPPLSVFGHADPVGTDDYNKALSGRRATVIYALLLSTTEPDAAVALWQQVSAHENWGQDQQQTMQDATGLSPGTPSSLLMKQYMQKLCPSDLHITRQHFLARGVDSHGKGDYQGCSEFNPLLIFSQQDQSRFDQARRDKDQGTLIERNAVNASNRRVVVLLFQPGSQVVPAKWPCPRAHEGASGCKQRFWSDGESRRSTKLPDGRRQFQISADTFACRFYQRISTSSPCEQYVTMSDYPFSL